MHHKNVRGSNFEPVETAMELHEKDTWRTSLRAEGEAIQSAGGGLDCFVANAVRNDGPAMIDYGRFHCAKSSLLGLLR